MNLSNASKESKRLLDLWLKYLDKSKELQSILSTLPDNLEYMSMIPTVEGEFDTLLKDFDKNLSDQWTEDGIEYRFYAIVPYTFYQVAITEGETKLVTMIIHPEMLERKDEPKLKPKKPIPRIGGMTIN